MVTLAALEAAVARRALLARPEREQTTLAVLNGIVGRVELVIGSLNHRTSVADLPAPTDVRLCDGDDFHAAPPRSSGRSLRHVGRLRYGLAEHVTWNVPS